MKIGILTHPQYFNYGGILQCYALCNYLKKLGHDTIVIRRGLDTPLGKQIIKDLMIKLCIKKILNPKEFDKAAKIRPFAEHKLNRTRLIFSQNLMKKICKQYRLNAVIVGSDQVWRADFALNYGYNYFLDFVPKNVRKLSYAASFGLSSWNYSIEQTARIKELLSDYKGVSVREDEAVDLCKKHLGIDVKQMPDPTMLLTASEYDTIASPRLIDKKYIFVYWLGNKETAETYILDFEAKGYKVIYVGLREQRIFPSVEDWLSYIKYADVVLTDSFHGCVFSILYHRPLKVCENTSGGYGRIKSLFQSVGVTNEDVLSLTGDCYTLIDNRLNSMREKAKVFINNSLS